eukprot:scaffold4756_cov116-Isochrysis_galbana.AAC.17
MSQKTSYGARLPSHSTSRSWSSVSHTAASHAPPVPPAPFPFAPPRPAVGITRRSSGQLSERRARRMCAFQRERTHQTHRTGSKFSSARMSVLDPAT